MNTRDPAAEWLRIAEHYRQMKNEELLALARDRSGLADYAQQALAAEFRSRGLALEPEPSEPQPIPDVVPVSSSDTATGESDEDDPYADDRKLYEICKVWSLRDARQVQWLLDRASIPFFMGPEKVTSADVLTANFAEGISVQVMAIGFYWAQQALQNYEPLDQPPTPPEEKEWKEIPVRCPRCQSTDVIFLDRTGDQCETKPCFRWVCAACRHRWQDDGLVKE